MHMIYILQNKNSNQELQNNWQQMNWINTYNSGMSP